MDIKFISMAYIDNDNSDIIFEEDTILLIMDKNYYLIADGHHTLKELYNLQIKE